ncbi:uncharacterized protein METZ01_LOCUS184967 [marine metagenome]|uniref:Uncharacterized protein n=1 Tax=marine metagenome TaxID=408172 RepID=A0A382D3G1_9ZZZZ
MEGKSANALMVRAMWKSASKGRFRSDHQANDKNRLHRI